MEARDPDSLSERRAGVNRCRALSRFRNRTESASAGPTHVDAGARIVARMECRRRACVLMACNPGFSPCGTIGVAGSDPALRVRARKAREQLHAGYKSLTILNF